MTTDKFCFYLQNRLIKTSLTGGHRYSDTTPCSIPWLRRHYFSAHNSRRSSPQRRRRRRNRNSASSLKRLARREQVYVCRRRPRPTTKSASATSCDRSDTRSASGNAISTEPHRIAGPNWSATASETSASKSLWVFRRELRRVAAQIPSSIQGCSTSRRASRPVSTMTKVKYIYIVFL